MPGTRGLNVDRARRLGIAQVDPDELSLAAPIRAGVAADVGKRSVAEHQLQTGVRSRSAQPAASGLMTGEDRKRPDAALESVTKGG